MIENIFDSFETAPNAETVKKYQKIVIDFGDAHVLASCHEAKADFLVTLDKKDFLNERVAQFLKPSIALTPKDIIELLRPSL